MLNSSSVSSGGQHGGRFVEYEYARAAQQRLYDLGALPLAHGQRIHPAIGSMCMRYFSAISLILPPRL
jgi:hypothetical protein